ncbi:hypothetical protein [Streptomyces sp. NPDC097981]|uniref:hypothetical protein n=1 Tax=Streptomyces sp. NPDC097981 TaxID=3155428 RepID=UPI00331DCA28
MGIGALPGPERITVTVVGRRWHALHVDVGNPHAVVFVDDLRHAGTLATARPLSRRAPFRTG